MSKFSIENETKLAEIETHLANNAYLSGGALPDAHDAEILLALGQNAPNKDKYPNFYYWYVNNKLFAEPVLRSWIEKKGGKNDTIGFMLFIVGFLVLPFTFCYFIIREIVHYFKPKE